MFDFTTPISFIWLALSIVGALIVLWIFLFLISITLPLLYGYQGYIRKVRLQLFLGLYMGKNSLQPTVGGDYVGLNRIASALRMAIPNIDRDTFDKYVLFLTKAGDLHQQPPKWYWQLFLIGLSIFEMFAYSLAIAPSLGDVNVFQQYLVGSTIAVTLGIMFYILMHAGGVSWYRKEQLDSVFEDYKEDANEKKGPFPGKPDILPSLNQRADEKDPLWKQTVRRITQSKGKFYYWAVAALVCFAAISMSVRFSNVLIQEREAAANAQVSAGSFMNKEAGQSSGSEAKSETQKPVAVLWEHWIFFIAITFVFVVTQGVSILLGYESAYASKNSKEPSRLIAHNYDWQTYVEYKKKFLHQADALLQDWIVKTGVGIGTRHKITMVAFYPDLAHGLAPTQLITYSENKLEQENHQDKDKATEV
jgi:hypothetical protein